MVGLASRMQTHSTRWFVPPCTFRILGVCGTFMGGKAARARRGSRRVTGCDANVCILPRSTQLRGAELPITEGYDTSQIALDGHVRCRQCDFAQQPAAR